MPELWTLQKADNKHWNWVFSGIIGAWLVGEGEERDGKEGISLRKMQLLLCFSKGNAFPCLVLFPSAQRVQENHIFLLPALDHGCSELNWWNCIKLGIKPVTDFATQCFRREAHFPLEMLIFPGITDPGREELLLSC